LRWRADCAGRDVPTGQCRRCGARRSPASPPGGWYGLSVGDWLGRCPRLCWGLGVEECESAGRSPACGNFAVMRSRLSALRGARYDEVVAEAVKGSSPAAARRAAARRMRGMFADVAPARR
jgi:hypothetical protein